MTILLTGFTGNVGPEIARQLSPHRVLALVRDVASAPHVDGVDVVAGSLESLPATIQPELEAIIHCAASVVFKAPLAELRRVNVEGTANLLAFARGCRRLRRFIHVSTTCVCGDQTGDIPEAPLAEKPQFVNPYEQSKWEAEQLVLASGLPAEIARLAIVAGSERDGAVRRPGALHHALSWLYKGLIPMMPGAADSRLDLISTEFVGSVIAALMREKTEPGRIVHVSSGNAAPKLSEFLDFLATLFSEQHRGWASGAVERPDIVDSETFALFEEAVRQSGDLLFQRVCEDGRSFLPGLLYPRTMATSLARTVHLSDWRVLARRVVAWLLETNWGRKLMPHLPMHLLEPHQNETASEFESDLLRFVNEVLPKLDRHGRVWAPVSANTPLFETGLLDSLSILHLIARVEELTGSPVPDQLVVMKHFRTVAAMTTAFWKP